MSNATQFEADYSELSADITAKIGRIPSLFGKDKHDMVSCVSSIYFMRSDHVHTYIYNIHYTLYSLTTRKSFTSSHLRVVSEVEIGDLTLLITTFTSPKINPTLTTIPLF